MQDLSEQETYKVAVKSIILKTFLLLGGLQRKILGEMREESMSCMFVILAVRICFLCCLLKSLRVIVSKASSEKVKNPPTYSHLYIVSIDMVKLLR